MKISLNWKYVVAFLALMFVMHEAHEIVHTSIGRLICGCWGERDFNVWGLCEGCSELHPISLIATFAGPIFTFLMIWWGYFLLAKDKSEQQQLLGFALVFANIPFARILTAGLGGGDEVYGLNQMLENHSLAWAIGLVTISLIVLFPLIRAYKFIQNRYRVGWFLGFFLLPTVLDILIVLGLMNTLLSKGILTEYWILGSPMLVTLWTMLVVVVFLFTRKYLFELKGS